MTLLPLPALVGLEPAVQAFLLLAIEPRLRGVVVGAAAGAGKSSLARGYAALCQPAPFVELPLGADEESLLGGLDMQATLRTGRRIARDGVLARAHGGALYADQINLLPDATINLLLGTLDSGTVRIERDGLSHHAPAHFTLIGSYDPAEGQPRQHLLDRVGLLVTLPARASAPDRAEVIRRNRATGAEDWQDDMAMLHALVQAAREQLPLVQIGDSDLEQLSAAALAFGVQGHRADGFAAACACASAALALRDTVTQEDLETAMRLVILPRATRHPAPPPPADEQQPPPPSSPEPQPPDEEQQESEEPPSGAAPPQDEIFQALATELPAELDALPFRVVRRGRSGSRGSTSGNRGRHVRSVPGDIRRRRIDIAATLRAAAPWQRLRHGAPAAPTRHTAIRADDLRVKQFRTKAGALFCFAVDASGSMALNRMRQAKGAIHALLQRAYVHRDRVALLSFRGQGADLLLPPSQSVELARRALDTLPTGGGTPLAAALLAAIDVAKQAQGRGIHQTVLVLLTDGRANVGLRADRAGLQDELRVLARYVADAGIRSVVVDTQRSYLSRGEARTLAGLLGGEYVYLPNATGEHIADAATALVGE